MARVPLFRAFTATMLALGVAVGGHLALGPAAAQAHARFTADVSRTAAADADAADEDTDTVDQPEELASLVIAASDPVLRPETETLELAILIQNPSSEPIPAGELVVEIATEAVADAAGLAEEPAGSLSPLGTLNVGATQAGKSQALTLTVPRADVALTASTPFGVHLLRAELRAEDEGDPEPTDSDADAATQHNAGESAESSDSSDSDAETADAPADPLLTATTPIVWHGPEQTTTGAGSRAAAHKTPTVQLGVIVPLVFPDEIRTLPTRGQLEALTPEWDRLLTEARTQRATLAIDPRVIAGIRAYGEEAPENSRLFLERLTALDLPVFLLQFADADPAAQAALGFSKLLAPSSLDFVTRFGSFPAPAGPTPADGKPETTPTEQAPTTADDAAPAETSDAPAGADDASGPQPASAPTLPELLAWEPASRIAWPAEGSVNADTLEFLRSNGITTTVVSSNNAGLTGGPRAQLGDGTAYVADASLSAAARDALTGGTSAERAAGAARLAAQLALAAQHSQPGVLLALDRGAVANAEQPSALLEQLSTFDWLEQTPLAELPQGTAKLRSGDTLEERRELLRAAVGRESSVTQIGAVLVNPEYLSGYQRTRLLELFATRHGAPDADFADVAAAYRARDAELLEGVQAVSTEHVQLVGTSTRFPVQLRNTLPFDARVRVDVNPASAALSLSERSFPDVIIPAEGNQQLLVPVHSRVSSGESGLVVTISATDGDPTVFTGTLSISIRSSIESIALWTLGGLAAALLGFGIWRSLRQRARAQSASEAVTSEQE